MTLLDKLLGRRGPTCQEINQFLVDYLDGTLEAATRADFTSHLGHCPQCRAFLDQYRTTIELVRSTGTAGYAEFPEQLVQTTLAFLQRHA